MHLTKTRAAVAAIVVAVGIAGFTGVGETRNKQTDPSKEAPAKAPKIKAPAADAQPDEFGTIKVDFAQMGKDAGLSGEQLRGFVERSEKRRAAQEQEDKAKKDKSVNPGAP